MPVTNLVVTLFKDNSQDAQWLTMGPYKPPNLFGSNNNNNIYVPSMVNKGKRRNKVCIVYTTRSATKRVPMLFEQTKRP